MLQQLVLHFSPRNIYRHDQGHRKQIVWLVDSFLHNNLLNFHVYSSSSFIISHLTINRLSVDSNDRIINHILQTGCDNR